MIAQLLYLPLSPSTTVITQLFTSLPGPGLPKLRKEEHFQQNGYTSPPGAGFNQTSYYKRRGLAQNAGLA